MIPIAAGHPPTSEHAAQDGETEATPPGGDRRAIPTTIWILALVALAGLIAAQSYIFWLRLPYDHMPDQDIVLAYNALVMNAGLPQEYFDHTGYAYFLLLAPWFRLLHTLRLLSVDALTALPPVAAGAAFQMAWQQIIESGRLLSTALAMATVVVFAAMTARLLDNRWIGALAGLALATSAGTLSQIGLLRTEPLSAFLLVIAVLAVATASSGRWVAGRFILLGLAAFAGVLAVLAKVFAFLPVTALPAIGLAFGARAATPAEAETTRTRRAVILTILAISAAAPATALAVAGFAEVNASLYRYHALAGGPFAVYQGWFALWVLLCVIAYARIWRVPGADTVSAIAAITIGTSLGILTLAVRYNLQNVIAATHPIEHMFVFATWTDPSLGKHSTVLGGGLFLKLGVGAWKTIATRFAHPLGDNVFLFDLVVAGALLVGVWAPNRRWALQAGLLWLISLAMQVVFLLRYDHKTYHVYSDPFTILAAAVVLHRFRAVILTRAAGIATAFAFVVFVGWGFRAEHQWSRVARVGTAGFCLAHDHYLKRLDPFPFCKGVSAQ